MGMTPREDRMANHIPRREFVITLGAVAATLPIGALAQQAGKVYRIGFLANDPAIPTQHDSENGTYGTWWRSFLTTRL
jgi:hypothetical protein